MIRTGSVARTKPVENKYNFNSQERRRDGRQGLKLEIILKT